MTRVSENSNTQSLNFAVNKAKKRLEDLQMKGSVLTNISRPSDNPIANVEVLSINSMNGDNNQYLRNANYALLQLNTTEKTLEQLTDILTKAKDIALAQASDFYDSNIRKNVSTEAVQLYNQTLALANKRIGNRYIFSGHNTLTAPFNQYGDYSGDRGHINLEVSKDFFVPINLNGYEVFVSSDAVNNTLEHPLKELKQEGPQKGQEQAPMESGPDRSIASTRPPEVDMEAKFEKGQSIFGLLSSFVGALENNDNKQIQDLLEKFDDTTSRLITLRTRLGSITNSIQASQNSLESENVENATQRSKLVDADIAELFSDITKQQQVLKTTYQSGKSMLNQTLLDFLR